MNNQTTESLIAPTPDKGLVTAAQVRDAHKGIVGALDSEAFYKQFSTALNAALAPLIEREVAAARLEEADWWNENGSDREGDITDEGYARLCELNALNRKLSGKARAKEQTT